MARTPFFSLLRRSAQLALESRRRGVPVAELQALAREASRHRMSRREMIAATALTGAAVAVGCGDDDGGSGSALGRRVAIVGAGMAGLHCAYRLRLAGLHARVYEASERVGGRMFTGRGIYADEQSFELGGELIDTGHLTMHEIASTFELQLDDLQADEPEGLIRDSWYFGDRFVPDDEIVEAFGPLAERMAAEVEAAEMDPELFAAVDAQSIPEWIDAQPDVDPVIRAILLEAYRGEYGLEPEEQSIFNLLYLVDYETPDPFRVFGDSDERFRAHDGSDALTTALGDAVSGQIETGSRLVAIRSTSSGAIQLTLERDGSTTDVFFDHVVLALPFSLLRNVEIEMELPGVSAEEVAAKLQIVREVGYGTNAKLMGQYGSRVWRDEHNRSGSCISDNGSQFLWDTSRGQAGESGILTNFVGGTLGSEIGEGTAEERQLEQLASIDAIFPGAMDAYLPDSAMRMHWPTAPFALGSYTCYRPGQWAFYGLEGKRLGNLHFCGEHCSADFQGFMEGAAETGALAAAEVLADLEMGVSRMGLRVLERKLAVPQGSYLGGRPLRWMARRRLVRRVLGVRRF